MSCSRGFALRPMRMHMMSDICQQLGHTINMGQEGTYLSRHSHVLLIVNMPLHWTMFYSIIIFCNRSNNIILEWITKSEIYSKHWSDLHWFQTGSRSHRSSAVSSYSKGMHIVSDISCYYPQRPSLFSSIVTFQYMRHSLPEWIKHSSHISVNYR